VWSSVSASAAPDEMWWRCISEDQTTWSCSQAVSKPIRSASCAACTILDTFDKGPELGTRTPNSIADIFAPYLVTPVMSLGRLGGGHLVSLAAGRLVFLFGQQLEQPLLDLLQVTGQPALGGGEVARGDLLDQPRVGVLVLVEAEPQQVPADMA